ncbi:hypothetical protein KIPB_007622, partial [Kipferlia bialata]|eukprot:g7622.t1
MEAAQLTLDVSGVIRPIQKAVVCPVCAERPKESILPCGHSFCQECISRDLVEDVFTCPECATQVSLPKTGVSGLTRNIYSLEAFHSLQGLKATLSAEAAQLKDVSSFVAVNPPPLLMPEQPGPFPCHNCALRDARLHCRECGACYCRHCSDEVHAIPVFRAHVLTPITFGEPCAAHPSRATSHYCHTCMDPATGAGTLMCQECVAQHTGHTVHTAIQASASMRRSMVERAGGLGEVVSQLKADAQQLSEAVSTNTSTQASLEAEINAHFDDLASLVADHRRGQLASLRLQTAEVLAPYHAALQRVSSHEGSAVSALAE